MATVENRQRYKIQTKISSTSCYIRLKLFHLINMISMKIQQNNCDKIFKNSDYIYCVNCSHIFCLTVITMKIYFRCKAWNMILMKVRWNCEQFRFHLLLSLWQWTFLIQVLAPLGLPPPILLFSLKCMSFSLQYSQSGGQ